MTTMSTTTEPPFMTTHVEVDDRRFPPGHPHRAGGLRVVAQVYLQDGAPCAELAAFGATGGGQPYQTDIAFALSAIEQQAWDALHAMDEEG